MKARYRRQTQYASHFTATALGILLVSLTVNADVQFVNVTAEAGIHFKHTNGAKGGYHLPEMFGAGGAFVDYDNDGDLDLFLVNSGDFSDSNLTSVLYRNNGDSTFTDVTAVAGVGNAGNYGQGVACGDYDNDGYPDLYVTNFGANVLYHNNRDGTFSDVTRGADVADTLWSSSATFFDYNRDGYLDLYVVNYLDYSLDTPYPPCGEGEIRSYCHPKYFKGVPDRLYQNCGDGTFADITESAGISDIGGHFQGKGLGVVAADFNNDGASDLYIANDVPPNYLFNNRGDGTCEEIGLLAGCAYSADGIEQAGMGVDAGDYNGDGFLDIFVTNFSYETNALYRNNGDETFTDVTYEAHLGDASYRFVGFGGGFFDYDNDGHPDLFVANGHIFENIAQTTDMVTYTQPDQLFHNNGDGTFAEASFNHRKSVSRGAIFGDYDNDGDIDLVVTQLNGRAELFRNEGGNRRNWIRIKLVGTISNRDGVGARIILTAGEDMRIQERHAGSSYLCSNDPRVFFGLGDHTTINRLEIRWPSGIVQVLENIKANRKFVVTEARHGK